MQEYTIKHYNNLQNKTEVRDLEQFYVDGTFEDMEKLVELKKEALINQIENYKERCSKIKYAKDGTPYEVVDTNPMIISNYFFRSLNPISNVEPTYSAEKLGIAWDLYMYLVQEVNIEIGEFSPTPTHFCKFAGITLATLKKYRTSPDASMRYVVEKIYDSCFDNSMSMAQLGKTKERSTIFRAKSELEVVEKVTPNVNVNVDVEADLKDIQHRIAEYISFKNRNEGADV